MMKLRSIILFGFVVALLALPVRAALDERAILRALSAVESGNRGDRIGPCGERSAWQFMPETWRLYTAVPFVEASRNPTLARSVAELHLRAIEARLIRAGRPVTARAIARAWNPGAPRDYAQRVVNIYGEESK